MGIYFNASREVGNDIVLKSVEGPKVFSIPWIEGASRMTMHVLAVIQKGEGNSHSYHQISTATCEYPFMDEERQQAKFFPLIPSMVSVAGKIYTADWLKCVFVAFNRGEKIRQSEICSIEELSLREREGDNGVPEVYIPDFK